jgi:pyrroline-5-carboxylate reductase
MASKPKPATVFIGGGRITSALLAGLRLSGYRGPMVVHDRNPAKLRALAREHRITPEAELQRAVKQAGLLILAVRPASVGEVLEQLRQSAWPPLAISLAAGVPLAFLRSHTNLPTRWARAMPSPVCRSGNGLTAVAFERGMPAALRQQVVALFERVGPVLQVPEAKFDAFTAVYSCSHGYHALAALSRAAEKAGLDRKTARTAAAHALGDAVDAWRKGRHSLEELLHEAATPGGIAATVMQTMDARGYGQAVEEGVQAGVARARAHSYKRG